MCVSYCIRRLRCTCDHHCHTTAHTQTCAHTSFCLSRVGCTSANHFHITTHTQKCEHTHDHHRHVTAHTQTCTHTSYGVATLSRIDKIISLFCKILSLLQGSFAKDTYNLIDPTDQSHPILNKSCGMRLRQPLPHQNKHKHTYFTPEEMRLEVVIGI